MSDMPVDPFLPIEVITRDPVEHERMRALVLREIGRDIGPPPRDVILLTDNPEAPT